MAGRQEVASAFDQYAVKTQLEKVLSSDQLPTLPQVAIRVVEIVQQDEPDFDELVATIKSDPAISVKILKTANSALFGFRQRLSTIEAAVPALGANLVRTLVLSFALARHRSPAADLEIAYQNVWRRSLTQAVLAETFAEETGTSDPDLCFTAGLLQDIGMLALLRTYPDDYAPAVLDHAAIANIHDHELSRFGFSHVDVGVALCRRWRLEDELVDAISRHHDRSIPINPAATSGLTLLLTAASQCADYLEILRAGSRPIAAKLPPILVDQFALESSVIGQLIRDVELRVGEIAAILSVDIGTIPAAEEILARAKQALEEIAIRGQIEASVARRQAAQAVADLEHVESQRKSLEQQAFRDPLTGAYNRFSLSRNVTPQLERRARQGVPVGFLFLDIDNFKRLNDLHGHEFGDRVLEKISHILHQSVRKSDVVIRYGGDEFLVVLTESDISKGKVRRIAKRICRKINQAQIASARKKSVEISTSVGAIHYSPRAQTTSLDPQHLIGQADRAMYDAKKRGGNQVHLHCLVG